MEPIHFSDGATTLTGYVARPNGTPKGAVLVFPTILNAQPATLRRIDMLAKAGYLAMMADFYGEPVSEMATGVALSEALRGDVGRYRGRLNANLMALRTLPGVAGLSVAAIGYCMGGQAVLELARQGTDLLAVVSYHGLLTTHKSAEARFPGRILVCHGDADPMVPRDQVRAFWEEMDSVGNHWHFHSYSGVKHGFTDPESDARGMSAIGYDAAADRASWAATMDLFDEVFA